MGLTFLHSIQAVKATRCDNIWPLHLLSHHTHRASLRVLLIAFRPTHPVIPIYDPASEVNGQASRKRPTEGEGEDMIHAIRLSRSESGTRYSYVLSD